MDELGLTWSLRSAGPHNEVGAMTQPFVTQFGEAFVGTGAEAAHINTVLGEKGGPVEVSFTTALAMPRQGHAAFITVIRPGMPVKPFTLFVNKAELAGEHHSKLTWGAAQAGVASGVLWAVGDNVIEAERVDDVLVIVAVWVNPQAESEALVYENNRQAVRRSLEQGRLGLPEIGELLAIAHLPENPFFGLKVE
jgi:5,6,7,8-tetrahydromethanopterin hydro-lyase